MADIDFWDWLLQEKGINKPKYGGLSIKDQYWDEYQNYISNIPAQTDPYQAIRDNWNDFQSYLVNTYGYKWRDEVGDIWKKNNYGIVDPEKLSQNQMYLDWVKSTQGSNTKLNISDGNDAYDIYLEEAEFQQYLSNGGIKYKTKAAWVAAGKPASDTTPASSVLDPTKPLTVIQPQGDSSDTDGDGGTAQTSAYEDYYDEAGRLMHYDPLEGWMQIGYDPSKANGGTDSTFSSYQDALNARPDDNYIPVQLSNGRWVLQYKEKDDTASWQQSQLDWEKQKWAEQQALEREKYLATLQQSPRDWIRYWNAAFGQNPAAPVWLAKYNPQLTAGQAITATDTPAPSGQWLNRAAPTTKQGLLGYADWSANQGIGMTGDDLLQQTANMLPTDEPYSRNSWRPIKQVGW